jgi:hypothetical protein
MVTCNQWWWWGHPADMGTEYFPIPGGAYHNDKTFHLKGLGRWKTRGEVYFSTVPSVDFDTNEQVMVYEDRYFELAGMGNLPDVDYIRIVPEQGVYVSNLFNPGSGMGLGIHLEWGTITAHISFPGAVTPATPSREPVLLTVSNSALVASPDPSDIPLSYFFPSGGSISSGLSQALSYQAYMFSDFGEADLTRIDFEQASVLEDVTITYLPKTEIVYQSMY